MITPEFTLITHKSELPPFLDFLSKHEVVAMDTEADSMHHYVHKLCLLQFSAEDQHFLIDPLSEDIDLNEIWGALQDKLLLFHGADYDLRMLKQHFDFTPAKIYDTMLAGQLLGEKKLGLAHLVEKYFDVQLAKANQKADWTRRPLPLDMQQYAALDTYFLHGIREQQMQSLVELGRVEWLEETSETLLQATQILPEPVEDPWRIRGSAKMRARELSVLKSSWEWRESMAKKWDRPPYKVISPQLLLECVHRVATSKSPETREVKLPKLPRNFRGDVYDTFIESLWAPLSQPEYTWPPRRKLPTTPPHSPDSGILERIRGHRDEVGKSLNLDPTLIANRQQLVTLALHCSKAGEELRPMANLMHWQFALLEDSLCGIKKEKEG